MKITMGLLAFALSLSTQAQVTYDEAGMFSAFGGSELRLTELYPNEGSLVISGPSAKTLWTELRSVPVIPASQFQPNDRKVGKGIVCEKAVRDGLYGIKKGEVLCFITLKNLPAGEIEN